MFECVLTLCTIHPYNGSVFFFFIVYSFDGILVFGLLFICTCAYFKKVPRLNNWLLSEKKGVWGVFYKGTNASNGTNIVPNYDTLVWWVRTDPTGWCLYANLKG